MEGERKFGEGGGERRECGLWDVDVGCLRQVEGVWVWMELPLWDPSPDHIERIDARQVVPCTDRESERAGRDWPASVGAMPRRLLKEADPAEEPARTKLLQELEGLRVVEGTYLEA